ncbi:MAG: DUF429 domain-containing protein [Mycobacteriaceae bacterium]
MPRVWQVACAGVDGFDGRWVIARTDGAPTGPDHTGLSTLTFTLADDATGVLEATADCEAVAVDVPLGLSVDAVRPCERAARARLPGAASSVFPAPARDVLLADDYQDACARSSAAAGKKISKQTWFLVPGIREFDRAVLDPTRVIEAHPELCFRAMSPGTMFAAKRTTRGQGARIAALATWSAIAQSLAELPAGPALDDVLDAAACAWTARRWVAGAAEVLGGEPDTFGRPMRIVV